MLSIAGTTSAVGFDEVVDNETLARMVARARAMKHVVPEYDPDDATSFARACEDAYLRSTEANGTSLISTDSAPATNLAIVSTFVYDRSLCVRSMFDVWRERARYLMAAFAAIENRAVESSRQVLANCDDTTVSQDRRNDFWARYVRVTTERLCAMHRRCDERKDRVFTVAGNDETIAAYVEHAVTEENLYARGERVADLYNRSAVKLAEIDEALKVLPRTSKLEFADVCCAPGGFMDYIFARKHWSASGYGFALPISLGGVPMAKFGQSLRRCYAGEPRIFELDITDARTRDSLTSTLPRVDLVLADGSTTVVRTTNAVDGNDATCDIRYRRRYRQTGRANRELFAAEWAIARRILRKGGSLLLKTFSWYNERDDNDLTTLALLREAITYFRDFAIVKPLHSRRTNDERYILLRSFSPTVRRAYSIIDEMALLQAEFVILSRQYESFARIHDRMTSRETNDETTTTTTTTTDRSRIDAVNQALHSYIVDRLNLPLRSSF